MAFKDVGDLRGWLDGKALGFGVQLSLAGRKHHVAAGGLQRLAVGLPGARVSVKVFMRQELQAIDKNTDHHDIAQWFGLAHQCQMAVVQVAHGGHKCRVFEVGQVRAQLGDGADDDHEICPVLN